MAPLIRCFIVARTRARARTRTRARARTRTRALPSERTEPACTLAEAVAELETRMIRDALAREGSLMGAARALDIDRNTLKRKLRRLGAR